MHACSRYLLLEQAQERLHVVDVLRVDSGRHAALAALLDSIRPLVEVVPPEIGQIPEIMIENAVTQELG